MDDKRIVIIMGVSGSGKTTMGQLLSQRLGWDFVDGDDHHPPENISKMTQGKPLNDLDRMPWLDKLRVIIDDSLANSRPLVLACSALKSAYRQILGVERPGIVLIYLKGSYDLIQRRMVSRQKHFMGSAMLNSQFQILEEPDHALIIDIENIIEDNLSKVIEYLDQRYREP